MFWGIVQIAGDPLINNLPTAVMPLTVMGFSMTCYILTRTVSSEQQCHAALRRRLRRIRGQKRGHACSGVGLYHALVAFCVLPLRLDLSMSSDQFGRDSDQWWEAAR